MPKDTLNSTRPTASSMATTSISSFVRGPSALYCRITIRVAAGAVAEAMAPSVMAQEMEIRLGNSRCSAIRVMSTNTVAMTACKIPTVMAFAPVAFSWLRRNSLPMAKAIKPSAVWVMIFMAFTCSAVLKPRPGIFSAPMQKGPRSRPATR